MPYRTMSGTVGIALRGTVSTIVGLALAGVMAWQSGSTPTAPVNTAPPAITGTPQVGQALTAFDGTFSGTAPITIARRWQYSADGSTGWTTISGATGATYTPVAARQGQYIRVQVQASNAAGSSAWISSAAVGPVAAAAGATGLLSGTTWPSQPQAAPENLIPENARLFATSAPYGTGFTGVTFGATGAVFDGTATAATVLTVTFASPLVSGRVYGLLLTVQDRTTGTVNAALMPGNVSPAGASFTAGRAFTRRITATQAHTSLRLSVTAGATLRLVSVGLIDMTDEMSVPLRISATLAQSNDVGQEAGLPTDSRMYVAEPRALYVPGVANAPFGAVLDANSIGLPLVALDPMQHQTTNAGGGGGTAYCRAMCDGLRGSERFVFAATGYAGGGMLAANAVWNRQNNGAAWAKMIATVDALLAQGPAGSTFVGLKVCQGEADRGASSAIPHATELRNCILALRARWGNFPVVILPIGGKDWDVVGSNTYQMIQAHYLLDSNSGDALSLPLCRAIPRDPSWVIKPDDALEVHYDQASSEARNTAAANEILAMNYGAPKPSTAVAPTNTAAPVVSGTAQVGQNLTSTAGTFTGTAPITPELRWQSSADGSTGWAVIDGATTATFSQTSAQQGLYLRSQARASNAAGSSAWTSSNALGPVAAAPSASLKAGTLTNPPISARLGVFQNHNYRPFLNAFKQAWLWGADNGSSNWDTLVANGNITAGGQIVSIPAGSNGLNTRVLDSMVSATGATGRWRLRWTGSAVVEVYGGSNVDTSTANQISFDYTANGGSWVTVVVRSKGAGQVGGFSLVHAGDIAAFDAGGIYRSQFLDEVRNYRCLRFDEWMGLLLDEEEGALRVTDWASRALPSDEMFRARFTPYEWQAALCNLIGADGWFCLPTAATDDHFTQAATLIQTLMPAPRHVFAEYTTKSWDGGTTPQKWCTARSTADFGTTDGDNWRNWYGMRSAQMAQAWRAVWGSNARLHLVVQSQADWVNAEYDVLVAPKWQQAASAGRPVPAYVAPHTLVDMLTVHAQIDGGMAYNSRSSEISGWISTYGQAGAMNRMRDQMLHGTYWTADRVIDDMVAKWSHYRTVCNTYGLELGCYEVGNHLNGVNVDAAFLATFSVSSQMAEVYTATFNAIRTAGFDGPLCMSVDCRYPQDVIVHGLQRYLGDHNPAWAAVDALQQANNGPAGRGASDFVGTYDLA